MPILSITTNVTKTAFSKDETVMALSKVAAKLSGKPESVSHIIKTYLSWLIILVC